MYLRSSSGVDAGVYWILSRCSKSSENDRLRLVADKPKQAQDLLSVERWPFITALFALFDDDGDESGLKLKWLGTEQREDKNDHFPPSCLITVTEAGRGTGESGGVKGEVPALDWLVKLEESCDRDRGLVEMRLKERWLRCSWWIGF